MNFLKVSKALADSTRYDILQKIHERGEVYCTELAELFEISQPAVSHHLKILTEAELVLARKKGQHTFYKVNLSVLQEYMDYLKSSFSNTPDRTQGK